MRTSFCSCKEECFALAKWSTPFFCDNGSAIFFVHTKESTVLASLVTMWGHFPPLIPWGPLASLVLWVPLCLLHSCKRGVLVLHKQREHCFTTAGFASLVSSVRILCVQNHICGKNLVTRCLLKHSVNYVVFYRKFLLIILCCISLVDSGDYFDT